MDHTEASQENDTFLPTSVELDLDDLDLHALASLEGTALGSVVQELRDLMSGIPTKPDDTQQKFFSFSSHSSHHSFSSFSSFSSHSSWTWLL